jgi:hypothetical protein
MGKTVPQPQGPPAYRDNPDHAETASMASAVLLDDVEAFPEEDLPSYTDIPSESQSSITPSISTSGVASQFYQYASLLPPHTSPS